MNFLTKLLAIFLLLNVPAGNTSVNDYIYRFSDSPSYSNYGSTGLIQMPNARFQESGSLTFSFSNNDPYINGSIIAYPFSWFEASYQYTDINNALYSDVEAFSGNQTYKDKGFDTKLRLFKETDWMPQIAVGARDVAGTSVFTAEYVAMSKRIRNIDFTFGIGWGTLSGNKIKNPFTYFSDKFKERIDISSDTQGGEVNFGKLFKGEAGYFGGMEIFIPNSNGLRFKVEYDGTDYMKEGFPLGRESFQFAFAPVKQPSSKFNFGFVYPVNKFLQLKLAQTKGNNINFGFSFASSWGRENAVHKKDPIISVEDQNIVKQVTAIKESYLYRSAMLNLRKNEFYLQSADLTDKTLSVNFVQSNHLSHIRAIGRVATILDQVSPEEVSTFKIINTNAGLPLYSAEVERDGFGRYKDEKLYKLAAKDIKIYSSDYKPSDHAYNPTINFPVYFNSVAPEVRSQIGGPDGFFFGDLRLGFHNETLFRNNINLVTSASIGITSNLDEISLASDSVLEHVRTDIVKYLQESNDFNLKRMQLNYFASLSNNVYAKFSAGLLEEMFGGYGGEVLYRPFNSNFALGAELWWVKQRDYNMLFEFRDYETLTGHVNLYYTHPQSQVSLAVKGGRFLAEDSGFTFDFSRRFKSGLRIGAFFSLTDISKYEFGEGSFDKGFYFVVPVEVFLPKYRRRGLGWGLRPLTRDGAAPLNHSYYLYGLTEAGSKINLSRDWSSLYD